MLKDKINTFLKSKGINLSVEEPKKIELAASAKAADGSEIGTPTAFEAGAEIYVMVNGEPTAAPDGEIALEDGTIIVAEGGKITEVKAKPAEEMSAEVTEVLGKLADRIATLEATNASQATELSAHVATIAELNAKLSTSTAKVTELSAKAATASVTDKAKVELKKEVEAPKKHTSQMTYVERVIAQIN